MQVYKMCDTMRIDKGYKFMNNAEINSFSIYINNVFYEKLIEGLLCRNFS